MSQRTALILSAVLTAFALVIVGAMAGRAGQAAPAETQSAEAAPVEVTSAPTEPDLAAYQSREAEYQALVEQANLRLEKAYAALRAQQAAATPTASAAPAVPVSMEQAAALALQAAPGAVLNGSPRLVSFQGVTAYEVPLDKGLVYVDAQTGQILYNGTLAPAAPVASSGGGASGGFAAAGRSRGDDGGKVHESEHSGDHEEHPEQEGHDD